MLSKIECWMLKKCDGFSANRLKKSKINKEPSWDSFENNLLGYDVQSWKNNAKKITLNIDIKQLKTEKIDALNDYLKSYKGDKPLYFNLYDSEKKVKLTLNSRKQKVKITSEFLNELRGQKWAYTLN
mgnify:CR=1 FL=1